MRRPASNSNALTAFIAHKVEIDTILASLTGLSAAAFNGRSMR